MHPGYERFSRRHEEDVVLGLVAIDDLEFVGEERNAAFKVLLLHLRKESTTWKTRYISSLNNSQTYSKSNFQW